MTAGRIDVEIVRVLEICRDIELYFAELYRYYGEIFADQPEIAEMWQKTAKEEENHASQFVLAINLRKQGVIDGVKVDVFTADSMLKVVKSVYDGVRQTRPTVIDALRSAIKLEKKLDEFHMNSIALFTEEGYRKLFEAMMKADRGHLEQIEAVYRKELAAQG